MKNYQKKLDDIKKYVKMESEEDMRLFDITAYELAESKDLHIFNQLVGLFDDDCEYPEIMFSLVHSLETYPKQDYVCGVLQNAENFSKCPEWYTTLIYGILNSETCLEILKNNLHLAKKEHLQEIFDSIYMESEEHRPIIDELKEILNKS